MELLKYSVSVNTRIITLRLTYCVVNVSMEDERMRILANLVINRILEDKANGLLKLSH